MQGVLSGVAERRPIMLLVSADGRGKSTFLSCLGPAASVMAAPTEIVIVTGAPHADWLEGVAAAFDLSEPASGRDGLIEALGSCLATAADHGRQVVVAVDDAHRLPRVAMVEILALANGWPTATPPATFLLAGTSDLPERMTAATSARDVRGLQRFSLSPWGIDDLTAYIRHRLARQAGGHERFGPEAIARVHELSAGEPATVGQIVARALQVAHMLGEATVTRSAVEHAVTSLAGDSEDSTPSIAQVRPLFPRASQPTAVELSGFAESAGPPASLGPMRTPPFVTGRSSRRRAPTYGLAALALILAIGGGWLWSQLQSPSGREAPTSRDAMVQTPPLVMDQGVSEEHERAALGVPPAARSDLGALSPAPAEQPPSSVDLSPPPDVAAPPSASVQVGSDTADLMARGDALMQLSDVSAARQFYLLAARRGDPVAYTAVAGTYDPVYLQESGVRGARGDADQAIDWYRQAMRRNEPVARSRLSALLSHLRASGAIDDAKAKRLLEERS